MADEDVKTRKMEKPQEPDKGGKGEKEEQGGGEVEGHGSYRWIRCWNCASANRVPRWWEWFVCWACGEINEIY